jgi:hypothetical protein
MDGRLCWPVTESNPSFPGTFHEEDKRGLLWLLSVFAPLSGSERKPVRENIRNLVSPQKRHEKPVDAHRNPRDRT